MIRQKAGTLSQKASTPFTINANQLYDFVRDLYRIELPGFRGQRRCPGLGRSTRLQLHLETQNSDQSDGWHCDYRERLRDISVVLVESF